MCGIAGFIDPGLSAHEADPLISAMLEKIAHRGPDARNTYGEGALRLGHNRLSIIDLSTAANQPMIRDELTLIFNGEIYNYIELREKLKVQGYIFKTLSDTEVILAAYKFWGKACVREFRGMWAFVIWDKNKKELFVSRDRFGIKPFYYIIKGEKIYFASEYKSLKITPVFNADLNLEQVSRGLQLGWICYKDETYFNCIKSLPAAHNLVYKDGEITLNQYWDIETGLTVNLGEEEKIDKFRQLFSESIRLHMRSDVPVASCLSGGLDSSAIVSMVQDQNPGMKYQTYSIFYEGKGDVDERPFIHEVTKKYPAIDPVYFSPSNEEVAEYFHHALYHADVPSTGSSFISQYFLMKLIGDHGIRVVLDGQGSDEYLGGYMHTFYRIIADRLASLRIAGSLQLTHAVNGLNGNGLPKMAAHFGKSMLSTVSSEQQLYAFEYKNYYPFLSRKQVNAVPFTLEKRKGTRTDNFLYHLLFNTSLPSLLHYEDRNSMAFSVESRVPFLDHRLVEYSFSLPVDDRVRGSQTKYLLRKSMDGILPRAIAERKDKKGFVTPGETKWLKGPLKHLLDIDSQRLDFLDLKRVRKLMDEYKRGDRTNIALVWRLATLNYWIKNFV